MDSRYYMDARELCHRAGISRQLLRWHTVHGSGPKPVPARETGAKPGRPHWYRRKEAEAWIASRASQNAAA